MTVQTWIAEEPSPKPRGFQVLDCPACAQIHFFDHSTGKLLGDNSK